MPTFYLIDFPAATDIAAVTLYPHITFITDIKDITDSINVKLRVHLQLISSQSLFFKHSM